MIKKRFLKSSNNAEQIVQAVSNVTYFPYSLRKISRILMLYLWVKTL